MRCKPIVYLGGSQDGKHTMVAPYLDQMEVTTMIPNPSCSAATVKTEWYKQTIEMDGPNEVWRHYDPFTEAFDD